MLLLFYCGEIIFYNIYLEFISWRRWFKIGITTDLLKYSSGFVQDTLLLCVCLPTSLSKDDVPTFETISTASANHSPWYFPISSLIWIVFHWLIHFINALYKIFFVLEGNLNIFTSYVSSCMHLKFYENLQLAVYLWQFESSYTLLQYPHPLLGEQLLHFWSVSSSVFLHTIQ